MNIPIFGNVGQFFRIKRLTTDASVFQLHYRVTCAFLIVMGIILLTAKLAGNTIYCDNSSINRDVLGNINNS